MRKTLLAAALIDLAAAPASAQVMYNGWNLGPTTAPWSMAWTASARRR